MSNLVQRLRKRDATVKRMMADIGQESDGDPLLREAATIIENMALALAPFAKEADQWSPSNGWSKDDPFLETCRIAGTQLVVNDLRKARAALALAEGDTQ